MSLTSKFTTWVDARLAAAVKTAVDEATADISKQIDALPAAITANLNSLLTLAQADITKAIDDVPQTVNTVLSQGAVSVEQLTQVISDALNTQQLANDVAQAIKSITGGLLAHETPPDA